MIAALKQVDADNRECLALQVDTSFASRRVTRVLDEIIAQRGAPLAIRCDNGPELTSRHFLAWGIERQKNLGTRRGTRTVQVRETISAPFTKFKDRRRRNLTHGKSAWTEPLN
jgi:hypothetical protein